MERLRAASVEGRLTLGELTERTESAYTATTRGQLAALTADLPGDEPTAARPGPAIAGAPASPAVPATTHQVISVLGDTRRTGAWRVDGPVNALAVLGDVLLDLRDAQVPGGTAEIVATSLLGDIKIVVPDGVTVELTGFAVLGDKKVRVRQAPPERDAPRVRVRAHAVLGDVEVVDDEHAEPVRRAIARWLGRGERRARGRLEPPGKG